MTSLSLSEIEFPEIEEIADLDHRPLWSVMIPTYNGTLYLEETLRSVLSQDPGVDKMQIEVIDDCSTADNPEELVYRVGQGRISFTRQSENLGQIKTWNNCIRRAQGHWVQILHQDDVVLPGFYDHLEKATTNGSVGAAFCRHVTFDEDGHWQIISDVERKTAGILENWLKVIGTSQRIQFASIVVKRSTYEQVGGFCPQAFSASDWEMWKRIATHTDIWFEPQILACFRKHQASETSRLARTASNIAHIRNAIDISDNYITRSMRKAINAKAKEQCALTALYIANGLVNEREFEIAIMHIKEALKCSSSLRVVKALLSIIVRAGIVGLKLS